MARMTYTFFHYSYIITPMKIFIKIAIKLILAKHYFLKLNTIFVKHKINRKDKRWHEGFFSFKFWNIIIIIDNFNTAVVRADLNIILSPGESKSLILDWGLRSE